MRKLLVTLFLLILTCSLAATAQAQWDGDGWNASLVSDKGLEASDEGLRHELTLELDVEPGHYVYLWLEGTKGRSDRISVEVSDGEVTKIRFPTGKEKHDELLAKDVSIYETGTVRIPVELLFEDVTKSKKIKLQADVRAQACTVGNPEGDYCKIPRTVELTRALSLVALRPVTPAPTPKTTEVVVSTATAEPTAEPTTEPTAEPTPTPAVVVPVDNGGEKKGFFALLTSEQGLAVVMDRGILWVLLFCFLGGLLVCLTPCVYPLIPITVSVIGAKGASTRGKAFVLAAFYVLGMAVVNAGLGLIAGFSGERVGFIFTYPPVVLAVAVILFALALGMFGVYTLQLPSSVQTRLNRFGGDGPWGVFVMGLVAGVVASPCSTPVLSGIILTIVAGNVGIAKGAMLMAAFSAGMGLPFLILGTFSGLLTSLPKSGGWMDAVKYAMGLGLVIGAYYFLGLVLPEWGFQLALGIGFVIGGVFLGAGTVLQAEAGGWRKLGKAVGVLGIVAGVYFFLGGLSGGGYGPEFLQGANLVGTPTEVTETIPWRRAEPAALAEASQTGKPIFIDFFTDECKPCKQLDKQTFTDPVVADMLENQFVPTKLDLTERSWTTPQQRDEIDRLVKKYSVQGGVPRLMFIAPSGEILEGLTRTGFEQPEDFTKRLEKAVSCVHQETLVCSI